MLTIIGKSWIIIQFPHDRCKQTIQIVLLAMGGARGCKRSVGMRSLNNEPK
jgi:hypothetical protein